MPNLPKWTWGKDWARLLEADINLLETADPLETIEESSFNKNEVIELARNDINFLAPLSLPTVFKYDFPPVLLAVWQLLTTSITNKGQLFPQIALGIPRNHAKTTLVKLYVLWCIFFTERKFILIISSTSAMAENVISDIKDMLSEPNIVSVFGDWKLGLEMDRQDLKKFGYRGRNIILAAIGVEGSLRGLNIKNERPDVMIFEDIQTREAANSKTISEAIESWMIGTAMKAKSPHGCIFIFVGNMYPTPYSILKKLKTNSSWTKFISGAILADFTALWPELHSIDSLVREFDNDISMGHPEIFMSEVLNDTDIGVNNRVDFAQIRPWKWTEDDLPQGKFIIIDPSAGKLGGDNVTLGYFEVYDAIPGLRLLEEGNYSPGNTIKRALLMAINTRTKVIAVEATAYQYSLLYWFDHICQQFGMTGLHFVELYTGNYSKNARITNTLKNLTNGEIDIHPATRNLVINQIANWKPLARNNEDGILDVLSYSLVVMEKYLGIIQVEESTEMQEAMNTKVVEDNHAF